MTRVRRWSIIKLQLGTTASDEFYQRPDSHSILPAPTTGQILLSAWNLVPGIGDSGGHDDAVLKPEKGVAEENP